MKSCLPLVPSQLKVAPYWSVLMLISWWRKVCKLRCLAGSKPAGTCNCPMLSQPKSTVLQHAAKLFQQHWQHLRGNSELNSAFEKVDRLSEQNDCANNIISQLMFAFTGRNRFISMESLWRHFKNSKPPATIIQAISYPYISKISQSIW